MEQREMVELIRGGVAEPYGVWADLGAGTGNFTAALRTLLDESSAIHALDRDARAVSSLESLAAQPGAAILPRQADITRPLGLPALDGVLMANVLHFLRDQQRSLAAIIDRIKPGGRLLLVEYDFALPRPWVPFPVSSSGFHALVREAGLVDPQIVGRRRSPSRGDEMYAAVALKPLAS